MKQEKKDYEVCEGFLFKKEVPQTETRKVTTQEMVNGMRIAEELELAWTLRQAWSLIPQIIPPPRQTRWGLFYLI